MVITRAPITAAVNVDMLKPVIILDTNQKNAPFNITEKSPRVNIFNGSVNNEIIGLITKCKKTKQADTTIAVKIKSLSDVSILISFIKCGNANTVSAVINHLSKIICNI